MSQLTLIVTLLLIIIYGNAQNVNIPDANFKALLVGNPLINTNGDGEIQYTEAMAFADCLDVHRPNYVPLPPAIQDLTGIEAFKNIIGLNCSNNNLHNLDLSANTALEYLICRNNFLRTLNLKANPFLTDVVCSANSLTSLNLLANKALKSLDCNDNALTGIAISGISSLTGLECSNNHLTGLDLSGDVGLFYLDCSYNQLKSLDVSSNTSLGWLHCNDNQLTRLNGKNGNYTPFGIFSTRNNPNLTCIQIDDKAFFDLQFSSSIDPWTSFSETCTYMNAQNVNIPDANFKALLVCNPLINTNGDGEIQETEAMAFKDTIVAIDKSISELKGIEAFSRLSGLNCSNNQLTSLDLTANIALQNLNCSFNFLRSLNLFSNTFLHNLDCGVNNITNLDITFNTALSYLNCRSNFLTSLDVSTNTSLEYLVCDRNWLISLDVSANTALVDLECWENRIAKLNLTVNTSLIDLECDRNWLTSLDISTNKSLKYLRCNKNILTSLNAKNGNPKNFELFLANDNPSLTCIQVDDIAYSTSNWSVDPWTSFSETCTVGIDNMSQTEVKIFPNPGNGNFTISGLPIGAISIEIYNLLGEMVYSRKNKQPVYNIDISSSPKGIYLVKVSDGKKIIINKIEIR
jgi:Leucine-rich repeat (LRR) protein